MSANTTFETAYDAGYDCGKNGANTRNCHFRWFHTVAMTQQWERGKRDGEAAKEIQAQTAAQVPDGSGDQKPAEGDQ